MKFLDAKHSVLAQVDKNIFILCKLEMHLIYIAAFDTGFAKRESYFDFHFIR